MCIVMCGCLRYIKLPPYNTVKSIRLDRGHIRIDPWSRSRLKKSGFKGFHFGHLQSAVRIRRVFPPAVRILRRAEKESSFLPEGTQTARLRMNIPRRAARWFSSFTPRPESPFPATTSKVTPEAKIVASIEQTTDEQVNVGTGKLSVCKPR
jgi:hypothetical protein